MSMGVYIDMEMPKEGSWKTVRIYPDGTCAIPNWQGDCALIKDVKAVSVPSHGRLIDADALVRDNGIKEIPEYYEVVCAAPTIIEAEEGE